MGIGLEGIDVCVGAGVCDGDRVGNGEDGMVTVLVGLDAIVELDQGVDVDIILAVDGVFV